MLKLVTGILKVLLHEKQIYQQKAIELIHCKFSIKEGSLGYRALDHDMAIDGRIFEILRPDIDLAITSYWNGFVAEEKAFYWVRGYTNETEKAQDEVIRQIKEILTERENKDGKAPILSHSKK